MSYFSSAYTQFFMDLAANNNRDWFNAEKKRYEKEVKAPFEAFVSDLAQQLKKDIPAIETDPKKMCFRIYRDIRFSKDKTPYKLHMSAVLNEGGRKNRTTPGMYIQFGAEDLRYYTGAYQLEKADLLKVRQFIIENLLAFQKIKSDKNFNQAFTEIRGEKNKILPKEMKSIAEKEPLLFNKNFYVYKSMPAEQISSATLDTDFLKLHRASGNFRSFLTRALEK